MEMLSMSIIKIRPMDGNNNSKITILDKLLEMDDMLDGLDEKEEMLLRKEKELKSES